VIHAVGPVYRDGRRGEAALLKGAYRMSLGLAGAHGVRSVSFPAISTGAYAYPMEEAARVALTTVREYLREHPEIVLVRFVLFGPAAYEAFARALRALDPGGARA
jgi:O-acetyl-ADP-ribose deacetylase (regulator of RNase III)